MSILHTSMRKRMRLYESLLRYMILSVALLVVVFSGIYLFKRVDRKKERAFVEGHFSAAMEHMREKDYERAKASYGKILERNPENVEALNNLGILHASRGDRDAAQKCFSKAIQPETNMERSYYNLGNLSLAEGDIQGAIKHYTSATRQSSDYTMPHVMLAAIYESLGDRRSAIREYEEIFRIEKDAQQRFMRARDLVQEERIRRTWFFKVRNLLSEGFISEKKGEYDRALEKYDDALDIDPRFIPAYVRRGIIFFERGEDKKARKEIGAALEIDRELKGFESSLADLYFIEGKGEKAVALLEALAEDYPQSVVIKDYLGGILLREGDYPEAEKVFRDALTLDTASGRAHGGLGNACLRLGSYGEAKEHLSRAVELSPEDPDNYYNLACLYSKRGELEEASEYLSEALGRGFRDREYIENDPALENLKEAGKLPKVGI